jgi:hypothetical protein
MTVFTYFAPPPLSTQLLSRDVDVREHTTPRTESAEASVVRRRFTAVDLDAWAREVLADIEAMFTPDLPARAATLDPELYADLCLARQDLANVISGATALAGGRIDLAQQRLANVYVGQETGDFEAAVERFRQALLVDLSAFSDSSAFADGRVPAPLRNHPPVQVLDSQSAVATNSSPTAGTATEQIHAASQWTYSMTLTRPAAEQDDLVVMLTINELEDESVPAPRPNGGRGAASDLFSALARFRSESLQLERELASEASQALPAYRRVRALMADLAKSWLTWQNPAPVVEPLFGWWYRIHFSEDGAALVAGVQGAAWPLVNGRAGVISEGRVEYSKVGAGALTLAWPDLDARSQWSARASVRVERNANVGADLAAAFVYRTPMTSFPRPAVPMLQVDSAITIIEPTALQAMRSVLDAVSTACDVGMEVSFSYAVDQSGQSRTNLPMFLLQTTASLGGADSLAAAVRSWYTKEQPLLSDAQVHVVLELFAPSAFAPSGEGALPLARFSELILPVRGPDWFAAPPLVR